MNYNTDPYLKLFILSIIAVFLTGCLNENNSNTLPRSNNNNELNVLTVMVAGTGFGSVALSPGTTVCTANCTENFTVNTEVTLSALADTGSTFDGFSGDAGCSDSLVKMSTAIKCIATFTLVPGTNVHELTVTLDGTGNGVVLSNPGGIDCGNTCTHNFALNSQVTLSATAATGSIFTGWSGTECATGVIRMANAVSCIATFDLDNNLKLLTLSLAGLGSGKVTSKPVGIECGVKCEQYFPLDSVITLTAIPSLDNIFTHWSGDCVGGTANIAISMSKAQLCIANFDIKPSIVFHDLIVSVNGPGASGGKITSSPNGIDCGTVCTKNFTENSKVTLTASVTGISTFSAWSGDCSGTSTTAVITMLAAKSCIATFNIIPSVTHSLTILKTGSGSSIGKITSMPAGINCGLTCSKIYDANTKVTLTESVNFESIFEGWSGTGCTNGIVTMTADITCTANFAATFDLKATISTVSGAGGTVSFSGATPVYACGALCNTYKFGDIVFIDQKANANSIYNGWSKTAGGYGPICVYSGNSVKVITNPTATSRTTTCTVAFAKYPAPTHVLTLGAASLITRDGIINQTGLTWVIEENGKIVLKANAYGSLTLTYSRNKAGARYRVWLERYAKYEYVKISNIVSYTY